MASVFSKIVKGELPCYKIAENEKFLAFLDITPVALGHTLVIPKVEVDYFFDMDDESLAEINQFAKAVALKLQRTIPCKRIGISVVGLEVPHAHMHLIPLNHIKDMSFTGERLKLSPEEFETLAQKIREA